MTTKKIINKINELYELREGAGIKLTENELTTLHEILVDEYNKGYDRGYRDGKKDYKKWGK